LKIKPSQRPSSQLMEANVCVCVCGPPGLRRLPAIHALTSPQLEGRGSGVLLSLYPCVFVREKHLLRGCGQIRFIFTIPQVQIGGRRVSLLPLKCRACTWVLSHVLPPAPP
uniref:Uncharacterized protein n=1 Tax=Takifugu rubripes TaxID=31033 RepID=A0A674P389_TAKRU